MQHVVPAELFAPYCTGRRYFSASGVPRALLGDVLASLPLFQSLTVEGLRSGEFPHNMVRRYYLISPIYLLFLPDVVNLDPFGTHSEFLVALSVDALCGREIIKTVVVVPSAVVVTSEKVFGDMLVFPVT